MGVIVSTTSPVPSDSPVGVPLIGYDNLVTTANVTSTTENADFPATNLANPSTYLKWKGGVNTGDEYITLNVSSADTVNYLGVAGHNFGTAPSIVSVEATISDSPGVWVELVQQSTPTDDSPIIFRWTAGAYEQYRLRIQPDIAVPEAAVVYIGELLVMERSIDINQTHVVINYGRQLNMMNGMSETGNFMGRLLLGEHRYSKAEFKWITSTFYRSDVEPFVDAASTIPFFWAWSPSEYPLETGFVWLTKEAEPEVDPVTRRVHLNIEMRGIA